MGEKATTGASARMGGRVLRVRRVRSGMLSGLSAELRLGGRLQRTLPSAFPRFGSAQSSPNARCNRRANCGQRSSFASAHSHTRTTRQPAERNVRVTSRSRATLPSNFGSQNSRRLFGVAANLHLGCRCQKQPSTNTATRSRRKTKSGLPKTRAFRRQPVIPCARNSAIIRSSVSLFPFPRIADITALRLALVKMSGIAGLRTPPRRVAQKGVLDQLVG